VLVLLLVLTGCSGGDAAGSSTTAGEVSPSDTETAPTDAPTPTGTEAIFDAEATLRPGAASGGTVPTRVDVSLTNIGTVAGPMSGTVSLADEAGHTYPAAKPVDFGTLAPGAVVVRSAVIDLPAAAVASVTTVTVEPADGIPVDGPAAIGS
jgi:hypothetical protein